MSKELKPCPFCGNDGYIKSAYGRNSDIVLYYPRCTIETCLGHNVWQNFLEKKLAIKAWNKRPK